MKRILILQTGGTLAMEIRQDREGEVSNRSCENNLLRYVPEISQLADLVVRDIFFKDSSDVQPSDWVMIASEIEKSYHDFDGFVVIHGTDTMAYTASALSFTFKNLSKPVIFTGSQVPLSVLRSDAGRNLINAIQMATLPFNEVGICFSDKIYRANRCTKLSIGDFNAFSSPNFAPLAEIGLEIDIKYIITPKTGKFGCYNKFDENVMLIRIFPGLKPGIYLPHLENGIRAIVISAFGSGNFPTTGEYSLIPLLEACIKRDIFVVIASQASHDSVDLNKYESGRIARDMGCLSGRDMTMESIVTKTMHVLGNYKNPHQIREMFNKPLAGEMNL